LGAIGDAGAVVTNDDNLAIRVKELREYGWATKYEVKIKHGGNHRMDEIQALILNKQINSLDSNNIKRREIWKHYSNVFSSPELYLIGKSDESFVAHLAVLKTEKRDQLRNFLSEKKIQTQIHYPIPDHKQPGWNFHRTLNLQNTELLSTKILSIPLFPEMFENEIEFVADSVKDWLKSV
jgi:dTDP-4-amino-4,6-dideoxygalactose transaminase